MSRVPYAALDPNVELDPEAEPARWDDETEHRLVSAERADPIRVPAVTMAVTVDPPARYQWLRFYVFFCLVRLAAWVWPMRFELRRTPQPWEVDDAD